ncbi:MAG: menaquinone biosynthesis decarboxylase [Bacteroidetes bacterium]|nr:MAG: menaquinone biosynthesis decarboxylase [Bacteroidota bacterium]
MAFKNSTEFIQQLEKADELIRIKNKIDPVLEVSEITDRVIKAGGKALLFENTGTDFPILMNAMGSKKRIEIALNVDDVEDLGNQIKALFENMTSPKESFMDKLRMLPELKKIAAWAPKRLSSKGACQEVEMADVDLTKLPVLTTWPHDGGPFITFPVVHTLSEKQSLHNMGMYRMQVYDKQTTGMHWHMHKGGAGHYNEYKEAGKMMPVTVTLGGDPAYTYAATAPLPPNVDEYMLAGFLRKKQVRLVKCLTNNIYIPEDVDFVLEGYVDPNEDLRMEGPFGDHTGYYSLADLYPNFHITKITHRKQAVYPATIVGTPPQEDAFIGLATERMFLAPIKLTMIPEMADMHMPPEGVFHNIVLASIRKSFPGQAPKVMSALWGAGQMMFNKLLFIFDEEVKLTDYKQVFQEITDYTDPIKDVLFNRGPMDVLDHASERFAEGGKMGWDATRKAEKWKGKPRIDKAKLEAIPQIVEVHDDLLKAGYSFLLIRLKKEKDVARLISKQILDQGLIEDVKFLIFIEEVAVVGDYADVVWRVANNVDPARDCFYQTNGQGKKHPVLIIDALRKTLEDDGFERDWPNIVTMDQKTIDMVDARWEEYGIGSFIESPSVKYRKQLYKGGAVTE